jgi:hypothetical protein
MTNTHVIGEIVTPTVMRMRVGTYSCYALATDKSGNTRPAPSCPDAVSSYALDITAPTSTASSLASATANNWTVSYTASDNKGGSGMASVELRVETPGTSGYARPLSSSSPAAGGSLSYKPSAGKIDRQLPYDRRGRRWEAALATPDASTALDTASSSADTMTNPVGTLKRTTDLARNKNTTAQASPAGPAF